MHPLETRDVNASGVIRECQDRPTAWKHRAGLSGVWLDTPMIESLGGEGTIEKTYPGHAPYVHELRH